MATTETKLDDIRAAFEHDINDHVNRAEKAFAKLEKMNISPEEYKQANWQFGLNCYVAGYLRKINGFTVDSGEPLKRMEGHIRFHAYQQRTKGNLDDKQEISVAQAAVAVTLEGYVAKFFED
ncbi:hypothetical protein [uncultured Muribaculum sp.]|uniref:hypothetical protein n=1 Tax=uncultured Muribaculum sp. TaxID=1918613 RepID=UPI0025D6E8BB|nr:hypothetical protein [uncultured Muribaculum sp.]